MTPLSSSLLYKTLLSSNLGLSLGYSSFLQMMSHSGTISPFIIPRLSSQKFLHFAGITFGERNSNDAFYNNFVGAPHSTTTPTGIIFYSASGNYTDGTITVYGVTQ